MAGFLFGAGTGDTATSLKRKRELIEELQNQIMGTTPKTTAEGIAAVIKGAATGIGKYRADKVEGEKTGAASSIYNKIMGDYSSKFPAPEAAGQVSATAPAPSNAQASGGATNYRDAIASIESKGSGDYNAVGPTHPKMGRALGRYQVMEANIGPWSQEALGRAVTPEEFMANPQIQDAIFDKKFGGYVEKFGPEGAAQAWFGGPGGVGKTDRKDSLGTSIGAYGDKFSRAIGGNQVASVDPQAAFGAVLADPSQIAPEDAQRLQAMRGPTGGNTPYSGPGAKIDTPMPVYDTNGLHMPQQGGSLTDEVAQFQQSPEYAAQFPGQQPQQAMPQPVQQQPMQQPAQQQAQPQPMPQAVQPNGIDPRILQALSDPFLPEEQRSALQILAKQQMDQQQNQQAQQTWQQRQAYEQQARQSDPAYQLNVQKTQAEIDQMSRPGYTALTAEERRQLGIPDTDQRVYQKSRDGKIDVVGGAGQTINVGNEMEARKNAAEQVGLSPDDPAYQGFILTGKLPRENEQQLTATDKKAILESDEMVQSAAAAIPLLDRASQLSKEAYEGPSAGIRGTITGAFGNDAGQATTEFDNIIATQALGQLKAIFGGAPTEGERAILLEISGASSQPQKVRDNILQRAKQAVQRRMEFYQQRADEMRGGSYYKPGQEKKQDAAPQQQQRRRYNPQTGNLE